MSFDIKELPTKIDYSEVRSYLISLERDFYHLKFTNVADTVDSEKHKLMEFTVGVYKVI